MRASKDFRVAGGRGLLYFAANVPSFLVPANVISCDSAGKEANSSLAMNYFRNIQPGGSL